MPSRVKFLAQARGWRRIDRVSHNCNNGHNHDHDHNTTTPITTTTKSRVKNCANAHACTAVTQPWLSTQT